MQYLIIFLFSLGLSLAFLEMLAPGFGVFGISGLISIIFGFVLTYFNYPELYSTVLFIELGSVIIAILLLYFCSKSKFVQKFILKENLNEDVVKEFPKDFVGSTAIAITTLKPVGVVRLNGVDYDVTSNDYVDKGDEVVIKSATKEKIVVEPKK